MKIFEILSLNENLTTVTHLGKKENLLAEKQPPIFTVALLNSKGNQTRISSPQANNAKIKVQNATYCEIEFTDFENIDLRVTVKITLTENEQLSFKADIESDLQLDWFELPGFSIKDTFGKKGNGSILYPYNEGALVTDIEFREANEFYYQEPSYPSRSVYSMYPGMLSSPFIGAMTDLGGIYLGAHDKEDNTLHIDFKPYEDGVKFIMRIYPGTEGGNYSMEFDVVIALFEGDWHDCAEIYKKWFETNKTANFKKIEENTDLPKWYFESPLILGYCVRGHHDTDFMRENNLFPYCNALPVIDEYSKNTDSSIMALLMHWEGTAAWAPPYVWPPYGGEELLKEFIEALHKKGNYLGLYCSGLGYTMNSQVDDYKKYDDFERDNVIDAVCDSPDGTPPVSTICGWQRQGYDLCPAHPFTKKTIRTEAESMLNAGTDYIQLLDQNHGGTPYFCYSKNHGHPPAPGNWETKEMKELLRGIDNKGGQKYLLGCESAASECFIPELLFSDNRYELNYRLGEPVPLYAYLYHSYVNNFMGNQVNGDRIFNCDACKDNLLYRLAYSFTAGDFLTLIINDMGRIQWSWGQSNFSNARMPDMDNTLSFVKNLNSWRKGESRKFLLSGDMVKPLEITEMDDHQIFCSGRWLKVPAVMSTRFKASDGTFGQVFANYNTVPKTIKVKDIAGGTLYKTADLKNGEILGDNCITVPPLSAVLVTK